MPSSPVFYWGGGGMCGWEIFQGNKFSSKNSPFSNSRVTKAFLVICDADLHFEEF